MLFQVERYSGFSQDERRRIGSVPRESGESKGERETGSVPRVSGEAKGERKTGSVPCVKRRVDKPERESCSNRCFRRVGEAHEFESRSSRSCRIEEYFQAMTYGIGRIRRLEGRKTGKKLWNIDNSGWKGRFWVRVVLFVFLEL